MLGNIKHASSDLDKQLNQKSFWLHRWELIQFLSLPLKSNQLSLVRSNFRETLQEVSASEYLQMYGEFFDIYCQSNDMAESPVLQGKLEIPDL